jgi:hypothetical protein
LEQSIRKSFENQCPELNGSISSMELLEEGRGEEKTVRGGGVEEEIGELKDIPAIEDLNQSSECGDSSVLFENQFIRSDVVFSQSTSHDFILLLKSFDVIVEIVSLTLCRVGFNFRFLTRSRRSEGGA